MHISGHYKSLRIIFKLLSHLSQSSRHSIGSLPQNSVHTISESRCSVPKMKRLVNVGVGGAGKEIYFISR